MKYQFWQAVRHADWEPSVGTACGGFISLFVWHVLQSGEFGAETSQMHTLGVVLITLGWACLAFASYLLYKSIVAKLAGP